MDAALLRRRTMARAILVVDEHLRSLASPLERDNFRVITPPAGLTDAVLMRDYLPHRTLITANAADFEDDVPVAEFSVIDVSGVTTDPEHLAEMISDAWRTRRLSSAGKFILRLRGDGRHQMELPE